MNEITVISIEFKRLLVEYALFNTKIIIKNPNLDFFQNGITLYFDLDQNYVNVRLNNVIIACVGDVILKTTNSKTHDFILNELFNFINKDLIENYDLLTDIDSFKI